jgi:hypothetical protein
MDKKSFKSLKINVAQGCKGKKSRPKFHTSFYGVFEKLMSHKAGSPLN